MTGYSYYASASAMSSGFYQTLLDRCWRRSGTLMYRPDQRHSCCPHYTIRLDSGQYKPSRGQRQTLNRFNRFVLGDDYIKEATRLHPKTREQTKKRESEFDLVERVHEAEHARVQKPLQPAHKLEVTLEHNDFTEEKFAVYKNYQHVVHKDAPNDITRSGFKRFLCSSPLRRETMVTADGNKRRLGSYHHCYRLDGKLVAIGVLDLLPGCVSSVYFLYDESIHRHSPGKLGALFEIALALEEGYGWWYPGFYIHGCPKMRYKIDYSPQFILDPVSLTWDLLDQKMLDLLDQKAFVSLSLEAKMKSDGDKVEESVESSLKSGEDDGDEDGEQDGWLFNTKMPGIPSLSSMRELNMDHVAVKIAAGGPLYETSDLVSWEEHGIDQWPGLKAAVAELVATAGPDLMKQMCLDFVHGSR